MSALETGLSKVKQLVVAEKTYEPEQLDVVFEPAPEQEERWAKFTTDAYYTPNNICIQGVGITPDLVVALPDDLKNISVEQLDPAQDTQLKAALTLFAQQVQAKQHTDQ